MLAGLLFANDEALDRPGQLTATLPFGGVCLVEYQARLLVAAGAAHLIVSVGRLTPELLGALGRIGKRGVTIDAVRTAAEASEKLHPLSHVVMLADGLITTQEVVDRFAVEPRDALLVLPEEEAAPDYERIGGRVAWAGVARIDAALIAEVAALPRDYDLQSTTLRLAAQALASHIPLAPAMLHDGHGIEHGSAALAKRGRAILASIAADRRNWFNGWIVAPVARLAAPWLMDRAVPSAVPAGIGGALGLAGVVAVVLGTPASGLVAVLAGCIGLGLGRVLAALRDEQRLAHAQARAIDILPALAAVMLGLALGSIEPGGATGPLLALALLFTGGLAERAIVPPLRRRWWASPPACLTVLTAVTLLGSPVAGLAAATLYAAATLVAVVETLRRDA
jgi:hypothetical protein